MASGGPQQSRHRASSYFSARIRDHESGIESGRQSAQVKPSSASAVVQPARRSIAGDCQIDKKRQLPSGGGGERSLNGSRKQKSDRRNTGQGLVVQAIQSDKMASNLGQPLGQALIKRETNKTPPRQSGQAFRFNSKSSTPDNNNKNSKMLHISSNSHEIDDSNKSEDDDDDEDDDERVVDRNDDDDDDDEEEDDDEDASQTDASRAEVAPEQQLDQAGAKQHVGPVMGIFFKVWSLVKGKLLVLVREWPQSFTR